LGDLIGLNPGIQGLVAGVDDAIEIGLVIRVVVYAAAEAYAIYKAYQLGKRLGEQTQIRDAMKAAGVSPDQYHEFTDYIHECKDHYGMRPDHNFTFAELVELAKAFKNHQGCPNIK
jgi:arginyl-tRNA--protein-N-Asp/Glu arginylyltransferase